ncbi:MAG: radical SAM/SPASM domain-containing protein [Candidatus Sericytochromatia bacterium]
MYKLDQYLGAAPKKLKRLLQAEVQPRPLSVKIKLTWQCNLKCIMCSKWRVEGKKPPRPSYFQTWEDLELVLDDLVFLKAKKVHFSGGEPLMFPWLEQGIRYLTERGLHVSLVSNGTLWSRRKAQTLVDAGLSQITFSLDSPLPETYRRIRGQDSWERVVQGIANTRAAIDKSGRIVLLKANTVLTHENFQEMLHWPELARELGIDRIRFLPVDDLHLESGQRLRLNRAEIESYNREIAPIVAEKSLKWGLIQSVAEAYPFGRTDAEIAEAELGHYALGYYQQNRCFAPWLHSLIAADGLVYGCCMLKGEKAPLDRLAPGVSFQSIWLGEPYSRFRAEMLLNRPEICAHCDDFLGENRYLNQLLQI